MPRKTKKERKINPTGKARTRRPKKSRARRATKKSRARSATKKEPIFVSEMFDGIYAGDKIIPYNIHKATMISFKPEKSCEAIRKMFGNVVSKTHTPPDPALAARGIRWVRFTKGGEAELHFVPPFTLNHHRTLVGMARDEDVQNPLASQFYENHVGLYVPDLTKVTLNVLKHKFQSNMNRRSDGLYQLYVNIPGALDFLEIDSLTFDSQKVMKKYPNFKVHGFEDNTTIVKQLEKEHNKNTLTYAYKDPKHDGAPRVIYLKNDGKITIIGRDKPGEKKWRIHGQTDPEGNAILNFKPKGGPAKIKAVISPSEVKFSDGNTWIGMGRELYNLL